MPWLFAVVALLLLSTWAYWGVWNYHFVNFDDGGYVETNPRVKGGLTPENFRWAWTSVTLSNWHPLTQLSWQLDATLFGPSARGFHITNLVLHVCNSILVFLLCRRFWEAVWPGFMVAALFAVHPQHVESVAWISERKDVLSTFFGLLAILLYCRYADRRSVGRYVAVTAAYLLSLLAKPMLVTLPFLLLVFDWWPLRRLTAADGGGATRRPLTRLILEKLPWLVFALAFSITTVLAQHGGGALRDLDDVDIRYRLSTAVAGYMFYICKAFQPTGLTVFYPPPAYFPLDATLLRATVLLLITAATFGLRRRLPYLLFGWLWFLGTLVPVIGLVQVGAQPYADRYSYFSLIGLLTMLGGAACDLARNSFAGRAATVLLGASAVAACLGLTTVQREVWRDGNHLWQHALTVTPDNYCAHRHMADLLVKEGRLGEAIEHSQAAAQLWPYQISYVHLAALLAEAERFDDAIEQYRNAVRCEPADAESHLVLGNLLLGRRRPAEAVAAFEDALAWRSGWSDALNGLATAQSLSGQHVLALRSFEAAVAGEPTNPLYHNNLGQQLARTGNTEGALVEFTEALRLDPRYAEALNNRGNVFAALERWPEAALAYREAIERDDKRARYRFNLAGVLHQQGDVAGARRQYRAALALDPDWPQQAAENAWNLATAPDGAVRDGATALRLARQACQALEPPPPAALEALAAAYAELGRFSDAVQVAEQASQRAHADGSAEVAADVDARLTLYREGKPFHLQANKQQREADKQ
ncbi:MAG TPA: tetratricopeptide repeat protein [Pirellulales bacterium]|nr:tetratricopeptide repeat protein [Pirellulales bacterium]